MLMVKSVETTLCLFVLFVCCVCLYVLFVFVCFVMFVLLCSFCYVCVCLFVCIVCCVCLLCLFVCVCCVCLFVLFVLFVFVCLLCLFCYVCVCLFVLFLRKLADNHIFIFAMTIWQACDTENSFLSFQWLQMDFAALLSGWHGKTTQMDTDSINHNNTHQQNQQTSTIQPPQYPNQLRYNGKRPEEWD